MRRKILVQKEEPNARDHIWKENNWNVNYRENREDVAKEGTAPVKQPVLRILAVQGYIKLAAQGKYREAWSLLKKENRSRLFVDGYAPHNCEDECTRGDIDEPIAIDEIKKFIADKELDGTIRYIPPKRYHLGNKIAVIGAGPAGLSCAYYLAIVDPKIQDHFLLKNRIFSGILMSK